MDLQLLWFVSRATGFVSLSLFSAVLILGMATAGRASGRRLSRAGVLRLHRQMSLVALVFLVLHIVTAILDSYVDIGRLAVIVPFSSRYATFWVGLGTIAVDLMIAIAISSLLRSRLPRSVWKCIHLTAYAMWAASAVHGLFNPGGDSGAGWLQIGVAGNVLAVVVAAIGWRLRRVRHPDASARRAADAIHRAAAAELTRSPR